MNRVIKFRAFQDGKMLTSPISTNYGLARFFGLLYEDAPIMQFTGLTDKNGKEIYEGDIYTHNNKNFILKFSNVLSFCSVEINKNLGNFAFDGVVMKYHNRRDFRNIVGIKMHIEVIGNIYENPELLK